MIGIGTHRPLLGVSIASFVRGSSPKGDNNVIAINYYSGLPLRKGQCSPVRMQLKDGDFTGGVNTLTGVEPASQGGWVL